MIMGFPSGPAGVLQVKKCSYQERQNRNGIMEEKKKVLFITFMDVYNIPAVKVAEELLARGYAIDFYGMCLENIHIRMFTEKGLAVKELGTFPMDTIDQYYFIYSALMISGWKEFFSMKKLIFYYSTSYMDDISGYGDYSFTQRRLGDAADENAYRVMQINKKLVYPGMAVGNPKFDGIPGGESRKKNGENKAENKRFVFIDSGHYPYGMEGKKAVAGMLLEISGKFPGYELIVKPRFLPDDNKVTHFNSIDLYDVLVEEAGGKLPDNIKYLRKHVNLEDVVRKAHVVLTTLTTSYLEAAAFDKGLIIAGNIPAEYGYALHKKHVDRFTAIQAQSGAMVPYGKVCDFLPEGLKVNEDHKKKMIERIGNSACMMVDEMERIMDVCEKREIDWKQAVHTRYKKYLYLLLGDYLYASSDELDFSSIGEYIESIEKSGVWMNEDNISSYTYEVEFRKNSIVKSSKSLLMGNEQLRSYYVEAMYQLGELEAVDETEFASLDIYLCLRGKHEIIQKNNYETGLRLLQEYRRKIKTHTYEKTLADKPYYILTAVYHIGYALFELGRYEEARPYFEECEILTDNKHNRAKEYLDRIDGRGENICL